MKKIKNIVSYSYDKSSAYCDECDLEKYADNTNQSFEEAFIDLESYLFKYDYIETEIDGRMIFHLS